MVVLLLLLLVPGASSHLVDDAPPIGVALLQLPQATPHTQRLSAAGSALASLNAPCDVALLPELWALPDALEGYAALARTAKLALAVPYERGPESALVLFDRLGRRVVEYSKPTDSEAPAPGIPPVTTLQVAGGSVSVGFLLGNDALFFEPIRVWPPRKSAVRFS